MVIFLYGPDGYRLKQAAGQILNSYKKKYPSGFNFFNFNFSEPDSAAKFEDSLKTASFFEDMKLIMTRSAFNNRSISEQVRKIMTDRDIGGDKSLVVLALEAADRKELEKTNEELFKFLAAKTGTVRNFEYLSGAKLAGWIRSEFVLRDCAPDLPAIKTLIELVGSDSWALAGEIEKLSNFKIKGVIAKDDVLSLVAKTKELNIFDFIDAVSSKNRAKAFETLYRQVRSGADPHYLLDRIIYGFRNLLMIKDLMDRREISSAGQKTGLHPFVIKKTCSSASRFSSDELRFSYNKLLDMDVRSKQGVLDLTDSLYSLVLS